MKYLRDQTPLEQSKYWRKEAQHQSAIIDGLNNQPSHDLDVAFDELAHANRQRRAILLNERQLRMMERHA